jgi:hypothetical protein
MGGTIRKLQGFVRDYTAGLKAQDVRRLFDQDAARAYAVLTRDQACGDEPRGRFKRLLHRTRLIFLGLSYKLTPARRLLFALSIAFVVMGMLESEVIFDDANIRVDFSPLWFLSSVGTLIFLLSLELVDRVRVRDELEVARQLQSELLPRRAPELLGYRLAHSYRTANEVGGDYYDFHPLPDGRLVLVIGDASGHGMAAGLLMAIANATLKTALDLDTDPVRVLALLNRALYRTGGKRAFMSMFYGLLDPPTGRLDYLCAGHPFPLLRRAGGEIVELGRGGLPLGIHQEIELAGQTVTIDAGDLLVMYSDGLAESLNRPGGEAFGFDRLKQVLAAGGAPQTVHDRILLAFDDYLGSEPLMDDLSLVVLARL